VTGREQPGSQVRVLIRQKPKKLMAKDMLHLLTAEMPGQEDGGKVGGRWEVARKSMWWYECEQAFADSPLDVPKMR
jgi:hypothetical protein